MQHVGLDRPDERDDASRGAALECHHRQADHVGLKLRYQRSTVAPDRRLGEDRDRRSPPGDAGRRCRPAMRAPRSAYASPSSACARTNRASRAAGSASCRSVFQVPSSGFVFLVPVRRSGFKVRGWTRLSRANPRLEPRTWNPEPRTGTPNTNPEPGTWNLELQSYCASLQKGQRAVLAWSGFLQCQQKRAGGVSRARSLD